MTFYFWLFRSFIQSFLFLFPFFCDIGSTSSNSHKYPHSWGITRLESCPTISHEKVCSSPCLNWHIYCLSIILWKEPRPRAAALFTGIVSNSRRGGKEEIIFPGGYLARRCSSSNSIGDWYEQYCSPSSFGKFCIFLFPQLLLNAWCFYLLGIRWNL